MAKINLFFGNPSTNERFMDVEKRSINCETSIENENIISFNCFFTSLARGDAEDNFENYFDMHLSRILGVKVNLPLLELGTHHSNQHHFPMFTILGDTLQETETSKKLFITDNIINKIGENFDLSFEFEYLGFKRIGKASLVGDEVIYRLRNKPHIYHEGNFLEIKNSKNV